MFKHILPDANRRLLLGALILDFDRLQCCKACSLQETECHLSDQSCKCWRYRICHPDARHNDNDQTNWPNKLQEKEVSQWAATILSCFRMFRRQGAAFLSTKPRKAQIASPHACGSISCMLLGCILEFPGWKWMKMVQSALRACSMWVALCSQGLSRLSRQNLKSHGIAYVGSD